MNKLLIMQTHTFSQRTRYLNTYQNITSANHRRVRDTRRSASRGPRRNAGQAQHFVPRVRCQAAGGRRAQPPQHDHGGAGERSRTTGNPAARQRN